MNNKILIEVFVPLLNQEYDIFIPLNKKIGNIKRLIKDAIVDLSSGYFPKDREIILFDKFTGQILDVNKIVKDSGLINGSQIILL